MQNSAAQPESLASIATYAERAAQLSQFTRVDMDIWSESVRKLAGKIQRPISKESCIMLYPDVLQSGSLSCPVTSVVHSIHSCL